MIYHDFYFEVWSINKKTVNIRCKWQKRRWREMKRKTETTMISGCSLPTTNHHHIMRLYRFDLCMHLSWQKTTKQQHQPRKTDSYVMEYRRSTYKRWMHSMLRRWRCGWRDIVLNNKTITHSICMVLLFSINSILNKCQNVFFSPSFAFLLSMARSRSHSPPGENNKLLWANRIAGNVFNIALVWIWFSSSFDLF